jgi:Tol biopolymer transport system component
VTVMSPQPGANTPRRRAGHLASAPWTALSHPRRRRAAGSSASTRRRMRVAVAVALAASLGAAAVPGAASAQVHAHVSAQAPRSPARVVFEKETTAGAQVFVTNLSGTGRHRLTTGPSGAERPRWSPSGKRILYLRRAPNDASLPDLMVMRADGRNKQQLLADGRGRFITDMAWAPGGRRVVLAMSHPTEGFSDLFVYSMRARTLTRLHANSVPDRDPASVDWSRDGSTIVFSAVDYTDDGDGFEDHDLYLIRSTGTGLRQITDTSNADEFNPRWSPGGRRLAYSKSTRACPESVGIASADGTNERRLRAGCAAHQASWSPNGRRLLVQKYDRGGEPVIWSMALDGSHRRFVTHGLNAGWQPR